MRGSIWRVRTRPFQLGGRSLLANSLCALGALANLALFPVQTRAQDANIASTLNATPPGIEIKTIEPNFCRVVQQFTHGAAK